MASSTSVRFVEAENWDIRVGVDVAVRSWNSGPAGPETQTVPFNARELHDDVDREIRRIAREQGWRVSINVWEKGGAFRPTGWFNKPKYTMKIEIPQGDRTDG